MASLGQLKNGQNWPEIRLLYLRNCYSEIDGIYASCPKLQSIFVDPIPEQNAADLFATLGQLPDLQRFEASGSAHRSSDLKIIE